jgi:hypothetical protein
MAEDKTNVYDSTGDKPTNWQEFEDADTSSASSTDVSDDELTKLENTFMSIVGNDTIVASLCSTVGAVLYQSWKEKDSSAETNMFAGLAQIISELQTDESSSATSVSALLSDTNALLEIIAEHIENKAAATNISDASVLLDVIAEHVESQHTEFTQHCDLVRVYLEVIEENQRNIFALMSSKLDDLTTFADVIAERQEKDSIANSKANASNAPNIDPKMGTIATAFATIIDSLTNMSPVKRLQLESGLEAIDLIVDRLEKAAPRFETALNKLVDSYLKAAETLKSHKESMTAVADMVSQVESLVASLDRTTEVVMKAAAAIALVGLTIWAFGQLVTFEALGMFTLGTMTFIAAYWAIGKITDKDASAGAKNVMMIAGALSMVALSMMLFSNVSWDGVAMGSVALLAVSGAIWVLGKALSGESLFGSGSGKKGQQNAVGKEMLMLSGSIALFVLAVVAAGELMEASWESVGLIFGVIVALGLAIGFANGISSAGAGLGMTLAGKGNAEAFSKMQTEGSNLKGGIGAQMMMIAGSIAVLALSIWAWHELIPDYTYAFAPAITITTLALAMAGANRLAGKDGDMQKLGVGVLAMAAAVGVLALGVFAWRIVEQEDMIKAGIGIGVLATIFTVMTRVAKDSKQVLSIATGVIVMAAAVGILGIAMLPYKLLDWEDMGKAGAALAVVTGALAALMALSSKGSPLMAAGALIITSVGVALLAGALLIANAVDGETAVMMGLFIAANVGAIAILGNMGATALLGGAALVLSAVGTTMYANALVKAQSVDGTTMLALGAFVVTVTAAATALGLVGPLALLGAAAMAATGAATYVFATALEKMQTVKDLDVASIAGTVAALVGVATVTGNPFTLPFTLAGATALGAVGLSMLSFAKTIKTMSEVNLTDAELASIGNNLATFIEVMVDALDGVEDKAKGAKKAINALSGLGNLVYQLSEGIKGMATLVFPKYEARNGELVVVGTIDLSEALPKVGAGLESVIDSLVNACINAAEREDFKKRMQQAKKGFDGIGTILDPLVNLITGFSQSKIDVNYIEKTFAPTAKAAVGAIVSMFDGMQGINTYRVQTVGKSLDAFFDVLADGNLDTRNKELQSTATNIENIQTAINSLNFEKLTKLDIQYKSLQSQEMIAGLKQVAATIEGPLVQSLKKLFDTLESFLNKDTDKDNFSSMNALPATAGVMQPMLKLGTESNPVEGADKYAEFADDPSNPVMSILIDIFELLEGAGIKVHK